jgi:cytochrome c oxidase assembly factor CtaG
MILAVLYIVTPFLFILAMQRELQAGRHRLTLSLLTESKFSVFPKGSIYPRFWLLALILSSFAGITLYHHDHLFDNLKQSEYLNFFMQLMYVRLALYFAIAIECLFWYYRALNELKRESMAASKAF